VHFKPYLLDGDFTSKMSNCQNFGTKDVITDKITYDYADLCRNDESKCGKEGKFFEKEENINFKILKHKLFTNFPYLFLFFIWYLANNMK